MSHLRKYLEQTGIIAPEQLEAALRRQQIYGGSLDTVLLELGVCDPFTLGELLTQSCGLEVVPVELLENGIERPWDQIPRELVDIGWSVPLVADADRVVVAVHPDLPNERLGELYRMVDGVVPRVTPECCLEKVAAERTGSVVPQRYAVLCAAYMGALRHRPSVTDMSFPLIADLAPDFVEDTKTGFPPRPAPAAIPPADAAIPGPDPERSTNQYGISVEQKSPAFAPPPLPSELERAQVTDPREHPVTPKDAVAGLDADALLLDAAKTLVHAPSVRPPRVDGPPDAIPQPRAGVPPVRFTARGTLIGADGTPRPTPAVAAEAMANAKQRLASSRTKDEVVDALLAAARLISSRAALFRIRDGSLVGMKSPPGLFPGLAGQVVPLSPAGGLADAVANVRWAGTTRDATLASVLGLRGAPIPCMLHRVDVAGRPVLAVYLDREGGEFLPVESNVLFELTQAASTSLEGLVKARRATPTPSAVPPARAIRPPDAAAHGTEVLPPPVTTGPITEVPLTPPPPDFGVDPRGWGAVPQPVQREYSDEVLPRPRDESDSAPGKSMRRETQVDGSPRSYQPPPEGKPPILTVTAAPPPPALPPPPPMLAQREDEPRHDTLTGLPPPASGSGPRFIPPPLDERENSGIISLAPPIDQPTARGRILLDEEDWDASPIEETTVGERRAVDGVLAALGRQEADVDDLKALGEAGLRGLAAAFPGTLEVLRRDLRALPPPSAHGPHIRATIRLGSEFVEHLLPLFGHVDPDVRFYAAFVFQELRDPRAMEPLSTLAFDSAGDVRVIAMRVLETYARYDGFEAATARVRGELESANRTRQLYAARALGTLRDVDAITDLIERLSSKDRFIQEAALESLCSITGQQHGLKPHRWKAWYSEHAERHRVEWVIDSVRHRDLPVRRWAHDELVRVTGHRLPFSPLGDRKSRETAAEAWLEWWAKFGRARLQPASVGTGF